MKAFTPLSLAVAVVIHCSLSGGFRAAAADLDTRVAEKIRLQALLDRKGFSPGLIDGKPGRKTTLAIQTMNQSDVDLSMSAGFEPTAVYSLTAADLADIGEWPEDWNERVALDRLRYESLTALLAERGHCTVGLLAQLNPNRNLNALKVGDTVVLPNVLDAADPPRAAKLIVNLDEKTVTAIGPDNKPIALMHCSIAKLVEKRPSGSTTVKVVALNPTYTFDPAMWPEVTNVKTKLNIPAGPRCPVGLAWIGLNLPGYGIHGTPWPELIGKTGSHGCFRLANWDAVRLAKMVKVGTRVEFVSGEQTAQR